MLHPANKPLRMRHKTEDSARAIGQSRYRTHRAIGVNRVGSLLAVLIHVFKGYKSLRLQLLSLCRIFRYDFAFAVCDGKIDLPARLDEDATVALRC